MSVYYFLDILKIFLDILKIFLGHQNLGLNYNIYFHVYGFKSELYVIIILNAHHVNLHLPWALGYRLPVIFPLFFYENIPS